MSPEYKNLRGQAEDLWYRFKDIVDDRSAAAALEKEIRQVVEDFEASRTPRSIEDRIKRILAELQKTDNAVIDDGDIDELHDGYEELRKDLSELDNY